MAFEYLGNTGVVVAGPVDTFDISTDARPFTAQLYMDGLVGSAVIVDIEVNLDPGGPAWRRVWTSDEVTPVADTTGSAAVPGLAIPPWPVAVGTRMVVTLVSGTGGNLMWDLFGL